MENKLSNKLISVLIFLLSLFWIYSNVELYYKYHYTNILFAFRLPDWVLFVEILIGLTVIYFGIKLCKNKYTIERTCSIVFGLLILGGLIEIISVM